MPNGKPGEPDGQKPHHIRVKERLSQLESATQKADRARSVLKVTSYILFAAGAAIGLFWRPGSLTSYSDLAAWLLAAGTVVGLAISCRRRSKELDATIEDLEFEIDLLLFPVKTAETRAEKNLIQQNKQLRRYYAQNLGENEKIFWVGIGSIVLGAVIIYITINLVFHEKANTQSKIIVAVLGGVGSLLTNFIAAIYLKMHAAATSNLEKFHGRLVETHQMLFVSLVASRIEDDKLRWSTLSKVAISLAEPLKPAPKEKDLSRPIRNAAGKSGRADHDEDGEKDETENISETD